MRTRRSGTVGLVVDDVTNPFYPELIRGISAELGSRDLRMVLWDSAGPGEESALEAIDQRLVSPRPRPAPRRCGGRSNGARRWC